MNYYNEFDKKTAAWLRELINQGYLPKGDVDERSIVEVRGSDITGYTQCHFFAGIGGWSYALQLAGWPTDEPVWTGSCPCQPFSCAGKGKGTADERHLWPEFARLISECRPAKVFGEQVASKAGREWLSGVFTDLEGMGYAAAGADLCAAGVGAPHVRQRLFWVADDEHDGSYRARGAAAFAGGDREDGGVFVGGGYAVCGISDTRHDGERGRAKSGSASLSASFDDSSMGKSNSEGLEGAHENNENAERVYVVPSKPSRGLVYSASGGCSQGDAEVEPEQYDKAMPWGNCIAIKFRDGKTRRIAPIVTPVAYGIPARVVRVRGYGNAIVPKVAAEFIRAFIDASECINAQAHQ